MNTYWKQLVFLLTVLFDDHIFVVDKGNSRIQKFDEDGRFLTSWTTNVNGKAGIPEAVAIMPDGRIAVTDSRWKQLLIYDSSGTLQDAMPIPGGTLFNKLLPYGIAVDNQGMITVSSRNQNQLIRFQNHD